MRRPGIGGEHARIEMSRWIQRQHGNRATSALMAGRAKATRPEVAPARATAAEGIVMRAPDNAAPSPGGLLDSAIWGVVDTVAPQLRPIVQKGPAGLADWVQQRAVSAAGTAFEGLTRPLEAVTAPAAQIAAAVQPAVETLQTAGAKIAANDCSPIQQAANAIEQTAQRLITPVIERVQPVVATIQDFLGRAWDAVGAPIWEFIKQRAAEQWDMVKTLASWIWQLGAPMRALGAEAWTWLKNKLGIGDGPESQDGILQWLEGKLDQAWTRVQAMLAPFRKQIEQARAFVRELTTAISDVGSRMVDGAKRIGTGVKWLVSHMGHGSALLEARQLVERTIIPPLTDGLAHVVSVARSAAQTVTGTLERFAQSLDGAAATVAASLLKIAAPAVAWVAGQMHALATSVGQHLGSMVNAMQSASSRFIEFLHGVADFLQRLDAVVADVWKLPLFLATKAWNIVPACIRDPVVDFVVPIIIRQVELFEALARDDAAWQKTKVQVMALIRKVFVDRDMLGAVKGAFELVLRALNMPPEMLSSVAAKAVAAWDVISKKPLDFIKNTVRSLGQGFQLLWNNITTHLEHGLEGWLFGELGEQGIQPPSSWTDPKALFGFVTDVLGLSMSHIADLLKKRINPTLVNGVQTWVQRFKRAWDWITSVIDTSKSPQENSRGLIDKAKDFGKSILTGAVEWVSGKVAVELGEMAAAAAASGGLSEVLDVARRIYRAMVTAKRWAGRILQMASDTLDHVLDIAAGNITKVGKKFEDIMDRGMPVVIGFLADQVGLGGIGQAIRGIVEDLRGKVDDAILWLIDKVKAGIEALIGGIKSGISAISEWWKERTHFNASDGTPHALYFGGASRSGELTVESSPMPVFGFLSKVIEMIDADPARSLEHLRPKHQAALALANAVNDHKNELQKEDNPREASEVAALNKDMNRLADAIQPLIDVMYPGTKNAAGLVVGAYIRLITTQGQIAIVESLDTKDGIVMVRYRIFNPKAPGWYRDKTPQGGAANMGAFSMSRLGKDFEVTVLDARDAYLGDNPSVDSEEGRALFLKVAKKMQKQNKLQFADGSEDIHSVVIMHESGQYRLDQCHLSHIIDAQAWWNSNGRVTAPRSDVVRAFMEDPDNYELEPAGPNLARGGALSGPGTRYRPPIRR